MISAEEHAVELHVKINKEIKLGRILAPFPYPPISNLRCNPIVILLVSTPKSQGGWRMISNLSHPVNTCNTINDHIDQQYCSVAYSTFDQALSLIREIKLYTDSSGSKGCGVVSDSQKFYFAWLSHSFYETSDFSQTCHLFSEFLFGQSNSAPKSYCNILTISY